MANASPRGGTEGEQLGSYRLVRKLGRGGMGEVWLAEHDTIKSQVAIKLVLAAPDDEDAASRFLREAKATARIRHPGVVTVSDFGPRPAGGAYLVMELLDGESLADRIERGALSSDLAIDLGVQIAEALAAAHASGVIHRDLKPANIFLVRDAATRSDVRVKLVDFGVAKATGKVTDELGVTVTGALVGTPIYMAPEQCTTRKGPVDHRVDLYALGVVLYEILTGKPPFRGPTLGDLIDQHINETPASPRIVEPSIPAKLDVLIMTLLAKEKTDRPASANDVARVLHELRGTTPSPPIDETVAPGARVKSDASMDATMDSGAIAEKMTQATGIETPQPAGERVAPAMSAAQTRAAKKRSWVIGAGIILGAVAVAAGILLVTRSSKTELDLAKATPEQLEASCRDRNGGACHAIATREMQKEKPDLSFVFTKELAACDAGLTAGCAETASMYLGGIGVRPDHSRARRIADQACSDGNAYGCDLAGDMRGIGIGEDASRASALVQWKRGCELGAPSSCESMARTLSIGIGVPRDKQTAETSAARARLLAEQGCARNDALSCRVLGHIFVRGLFGEKDLARGATNSQRACELGNADACSEIGEFYALGIGVAKNPEKARQSLQRGCDRGSAGACETLAVALANELVGKADPEGALALAKQTCETFGDAHCLILGQFHQIGTGTPRSNKLASVAYERACRGGAAMACTALATMPIEGTTVDPVKSQTLLERGCSLGEPSACSILGQRAYAKKEEASNREAFRYFEQACALSDGQIACELVSRSLFYGEGTPADPARGLALLVDGCDNESAVKSCIVLGIRYREGKGLPKSPAKAVQYFEKACTLALGEGCVSAADLLLNDASGIGRDERRAIVLIDKACQLESRYCTMVDTKAPLGHDGLFKREEGTTEGAMYGKKPKPSAAGSGSAGSGSAVK